MYVNVAETYLRHMFSYTHRPRVPGVSDERLGNCADQLASVVEVLFMHHDVASVVLEHPDLTRQAGDALAFYRELRPDP